MMRVLIGRLPVPQLPSLLLDALPDQGSIELQHDAAKKEHAWHAHQTDETLIILAGAFRLYREGGSEICRLGNVIKLPAGTRHGSIALDEGAIYLIAFRKLEL
jgi:quercetin dioxygenase-like cupin family protein